MTAYNPYSPPNSELLREDAAASDHIELAERGTRLGASMLDGIILAIPVALMLWAFYAAFQERFWDKVPGVKGILLSICAVAIGGLIDLAINGVFLRRNGQTVGKKICGIKIIKPTGEVPSLFDSFIKRRLVFSFAQQIPILGGIVSLVDVLLIFRDNRRCLHDQLANTIVVKA